jgi:hypothetical protein
MAGNGNGGYNNNQHNAQPYYNNQYSQPAPPYSPPAQPYGSNQGYYGQQQGVELQSPQQAHVTPGGDQTYAPPPGPPPAKA